MNRWIDDNPFCDLPHGYEFHLDYFDRFVLQTSRGEKQDEFSFLLMCWLELGRLSKDEESEDSPGLPPTAHRPPPTAP